MVCSRGNKRGLDLTDLFATGFAVAIGHMFLMDKDNNQVDFGIILNRLEVELQKGKKDSNRRNAHEKVAQR
jgi:hypothetical protein